MDAPAGFCALCGKTAKNAHHITGRGLDGNQLDVEFTVDLCHHHHVLIHSDLRTQAIDIPPEGMWTVTARIAHVLRRMAVFLARYAENADNPMWTMFAAMLERCADEIDYIDSDLHPIGSIA
jgi:hypothetical protein